MDSKQRVFVCWDNNLPLQPATGPVAMSAAKLVSALSFSNISQNAWSKELVFEQPNGFYMIDRSYSPVVDANRNDISLLQTFATYYCQYYHIYRNKNIDAFKQYLWKVNSKRQTMKWTMSVRKAKAIYEYAVQLDSSPLPQRCSSQEPEYPPSLGERALSILYSIIDVGYVVYGTFRYSGVLKAVRFVPSLLIGSGLTYLLLRRRKGYKEQAGAGAARLGYSLFLNMLVFFQVYLVLFKSQIMTDIIATVAVLAVGFCIQVAVCRFIMQIRMRKAVTQTLLLNSMLLVCIFVWLFFRDMQHVLHPWVS